jgi:hypothetical protein
LEQIFTAENHELPRQDVADFLEEIDPNLSIQYIEYLIDERKETGDVLHDQLAELYLHDALTSNHSDGEMVLSLQTIVKSDPSQMIKPSQIPDLSPFYKHPPIIVLIVFWVSFLMMVSNAYPQ